MNREQARNLTEAHRPDFAFVDIHLQDGPTGIDVGRDLASQGIPYVFVSGNIKKIPEDFAGALGAIEKPYTVNSMKNALAYISAIVAGDGILDSTFTRYIRILEVSLFGFSGLLQRRAAR